MKAFAIVRITSLSPAMFSTFSTRSLSNLLKLPSTAEHQLRSRRHNISMAFAIYAKFRSTVRVAWLSLAMFLMSATCHLSDLLGRRRGESVATAIAVSHGASFLIHKRKCNGLCDICGILIDPYC